MLGGGGDDEQDGGDRPPVALRATCRVLCALVHYYKKTRTRTMLQAAWRPRLPKTALGDAPNSKLEKLRRSVRGRLVNAFSQAVVDRAMTSVVETIEAEWGR